MTSPQLDLANTDLKDLTLEQVNAIDPSKFKIGTDLQDCAIIAQTFEQAAHATPTEQATFATMSRSLSNTLSFAPAARTSLNSFLNVPKSDASTAAAQAKKFASAAAPNATGGAAPPSDAILQAIKLARTKSATHGSNFGDQLLKFARECIPCTGRLLAFLELKPSVDLLAVYEADLKARLGILRDIGSLFTNFDVYGDFCELMELLSDICIPDLQRIIALLMALLTLETPQLDGLIGMLQALIAPLFSPILQAIASLLDQFVSLIVDPIQCIIDALQRQIEKLGRGVTAAEDALGTNTSTGANLTRLSGGLQTLHLQLTDAVRQLRAKLNFYIDEFKALIGEVDVGDAAYLSGSLKKLQIIRLISFIRALISALIQGHSACSPTQGKSPDRQELDSFFDTFLNPNQSFSISVDPAGQLVIDQKVPGVAEIIAPPTDPAGQPTGTGKTLPSTGNVFQFDGKDLVSKTMAQQIDDAAASLNNTANIIIPCRLETDASNVDKVNRWISELSK